LGTKLIDGDFIMRRLLLLATAGLFLALGAAGAHAALDRQAPGAASSAPLIEGRSALTQGAGDKNSAGALANQVLLAGATALVLALGGVGVKALWAQDRVEFSPYGVVLNEPPSCDSSDSHPA
jgi:hypothetical protein